MIYSILIVLNIFTFRKLCNTEQCLVLTHNIDGIRSLWLYVFNCANNAVRSRAVRWYICGVYMVYMDLVQIPYVPAETLRKISPIN